MTDEGVPHMKGSFGMAVLTSVVLMAGPALAHPKLVKAQPAKGASLKKAPAKIQLWFHEELDTKLSTFTVHNQKNDRMDTGDVKVTLDDRTLMEGSVGRLAPGRYTVRWKAAGDDDKVVVEGTLTFRVRE